MPLAPAINGTLKPIFHLALLISTFSCLAFRAIYTQAAPFESGWSHSWSPGFYANGASGDVLAMVQYGADLVVGGRFSSAGDQVADGVARWDGVADEGRGAWQSLGQGMDGPVFALAAGGSGELYAGGVFRFAGGVPASGIARWNGSQWQPLGAGIAGSVQALAVDGQGGVIAGGNFSMAGGVPSANIARWDGSAWHALGDGLTSAPLEQASVAALRIDQHGNLVAGGTFNRAGQKPVSNLARWNGKEWEDLGGGVGAQGEQAAVYALAEDRHGRLCAGGYFSQAGKVSAANIACWDGSTWSALGAGLQSEAGDLRPVQSLLLSGEGLYAGGNFDHSGKTSLQVLAIWDGSRWIGMGGVSSNPGQPAWVAALAPAQNGGIYAGGAFQSAGGAGANNIARWDGYLWQPLGEDHATNSPVEAIALDGSGGLFLAGTFSTAGGASASHVARLEALESEGAWWQLGEGIQAGEGDPQLHSASDAHGTYYVGGRFERAGEVAAANIARWAGGAWEALGSGLNGPVNALAVDSHGILYAGGAFESAGGQVASNIARWDGIGWQPLGSGLDGPVYALAVDGQDRLVAGGAFLHTGGLPSGRIARWDGEAWQALEGWSWGDVYAVAVRGEAIYAGSEYLVAAWNGQEWRALPGRLDNAPRTPWVQALELDNRGNLYAAGEFTRIGDLVANNIARWDGQRWHALEGGVNGRVAAMEVDSQGRLWLGGSFTQAGPLVSNHLALWLPAVEIYLPVVTR